MTLPLLTDVDISGKRVLVSVDFNVSLTANQTIANDSRIRGALPTIQHLLEKNATVILLSHLGRPEGKKDPHLTLAPVASRLGECLGKPVMLLPDFWTQEAQAKVTALPAGSLILCENTRFHPGEEQNDPQFAKDVARLGDLFVNDNFGTAHRVHMSTVGLASLLPSVAGLLLVREVEMISRAVNNSDRPLLVIIGGGKTPEKIKVIEKLLDIADTIYLGGAIANTFFATWGISVGVSKVDHEMIEMARTVLWKATRVHSRLLLPPDVVVSNMKRETEPFILPYNKVSAALSIFDIGPEAIAEMSELTKGAKTIIWNGPMGLYEDPRFTTGTVETLKAMAASSAETIIGGGDTISTINDPSLLSTISHISTGGGAMLEFIEKGTLPAIEALKNGKKT